MLSVHFQFVHFDPRLQTCEYTSGHKDAYENVSDVAEMACSNENVKPDCTNEDYENVVKAQDVDETAQLSNDEGEGENCDYTNDVDSDTSSLNYSIIVFHK